MAFGPATANRDAVEFTTRFAPQVAFRTTVRTTLGTVPGTVPTVVRRASISAISKRMIMLTFGETASYEKDSKEDAVFFTGRAFW